MLRPRTIYNAGLRLAAGTAWGVARLGQSHGAADQAPAGCLRQPAVGGWLPLLCVMNLTGVTEEVAGGFAMDHAALTAAAREVPLGCDGLLWLPYLAGERVPDLPEATGTLEGMRAGHLRPGVLFRAAMEGTSLNLGWGVDRMRALGIEVEAVNLVGGAARKVGSRRRISPMMWLSK